VGADADVASGLIHTGPLAPLLLHWVEAAYGVGVLVAVEAADYVDYVVEAASAVVGAGRHVRVRGQEPPVGPVSRATLSLQPLSPTHSWPRWPRWPR
jgi:hypothetical protein